MLLNKPVKEFYVSTISDNPSRIFQNLDAFESSVITGIHFDMMDGLFVPRIGLYPELLHEIRRRSSLTIEVHSMLTRTAPFVPIIADAGADRLIVHLETEEKIESLIEIAHEHKLQIGLAISPSSKILVSDELLSTIDTLMLMAVHPGGIKQPMIHGTHGRIQEARSLLSSNTREIALSIDGGVNFDNIEQLSSLGVNRFICGSGTIFNSMQTVEQNLNFLSSIHQTL